MRTGWHRPRWRARPVVSEALTQRRPAIAPVAGERVPLRLAEVARLQVDPLGILGLVVLVLLWWAATQLQLVSPLFLPPPGGVARAIAENFFASPYLANFHLGAGGLLASLAYTVSNVLIALAIACVIGIALGLMSARIAFLRAVLDPVVLTAGTIPILVTAPFFLIWFGTSRTAQVSLLVLYSVTIIYLFAQRAVANLDPIYVAAGRTLGADTRRILFDVYFFGTLPEVFGGIRIALAGAWGLEAFSELLGAREGIGRVIQAMANGMDTQTMAAAILTLAIVAVGFDMIVAAAFGFITRWRRPVSL
jgi:ABC-type nitrate/sulfonate/bicarbonate transport system permease component